MYLFEQYKLKQDKNGCTVILYLNSNLFFTEFADEFGHIKNEKTEQLHESVKKYIKEKFPNIKVNAAKLMIGSMLMASIPLGSTQAFAYANSAYEKNVSYTQGINIILDGKVQRYNQAPILINNTTYVPIRGVAESIGAKVWWNGESKTVGINKGDTKIAFVVGSNIARVNGKVISMPPSFIINNTTMVPLRFVSENLGLNVKWDQSSRTVILTTETVLETTSEATMYTVVSRDTLSLIAKRYGTTVDAIKTRNNLTSDIIYIGQVLTVPKTETTEPTEKDPVPETTSEATMYTVISGDTLSSIATRFHTTVNAIKTTNGLTTDMIYIDQTLTIPTITEHPPADTVAPAIPKLTPTGTITTKNAASLTVAGTTEANTTVQLSVTDGTLSPITYQINADANGRFEETVDVTSLTDGTITITATAVDVAGNRSTESRVTVKKDTRTVTPTIFLSNVINQKNVLTYPVTGTAEVRASVQIIVSDGVNPVVKKQVVANDRGEFQTFINISKLQDGDISISAKATDLSGNESMAMNVTVVKDTAILQPTVAVLQTINREFVDYVLIRGAGEPRATIIIRATDGVSPSVVTEVTSNETGDYEANLDLSSLNDGTITITTKGIDQSGNESEMSETTVTKDTVSVEPVLDNREQVTNENANNYTIFGVSTDPGAFVEIKISDGVNPEITAEATVNESGEFRTNVDLRTLHDGQLMIMAIATDQVGNRSVAHTTTLFKETSIEPPVIESKDIVNSQTANQYSVFGIAQPGSTVEITVSDGINQDVRATAGTDVNGEFHVNVDVSTLQDTTLTILVTQTSKVDITSKVGETTIEKDTSAPLAPVFNNNNFINQENEGSYLVTGTGEAHAQVQANISGANGQSMEIRETADKNGDYRIPINLSTFNDGDVTFSITQIDQAGNVSPATTKTLIKDTVKPATINVDPLISIYNGNENEYTISGTAEPNNTIDTRLTDNIITITETVTTDHNGQFKRSIDGSTLKDGDITVSFIPTDRAGNTGEPQSVMIRKDTTSPREVALNVTDHVNIQTMRAFPIRGSSEEEGAQVEIVVSDGTTEIIRTTEVMNGTIDDNIDLSILDDGLLTIEITQTDRAGNSSIVKTATIDKDTVIENPLVTKNGFRSENLQLIYTVIGTAESYATIEVSITDSFGNEPITMKGVADTNGFYTIDVNLYDLNTSEVITATVRQIDQAENISEMTSVALNSYTVKEGDSLYTIAKRYNTTVDTLIAINHLSSDVIQPNQTLRLPVTASEVINLGYLYFGNTERYIEAVNQTGRSVNIVSPSYFDINSGGTLKLTYQIDRNFIETMHKQGVRVVPFLSNHWNRDVGRAMLQNKELVVQQIADAIEQYNLDGINVDIENITEVDRTNYTEFVRLLRQKIPKTKEVSIAVAANPNGWTSGWHGSYDYSNLAKYADYLMIMSYDESYPGSLPGPVASRDWVEKSIQYAIHQDVPRDKIVLGIAHYGRYWIEGKSYGGFGILNAKVKELIKTYNGTVSFDEASRTPKATFTINVGDPITFVTGASLNPGTYTIWYENEQSIREKLAFVSQYNIRGVGNWSLGQENTGIWNNYLTALPTTVHVTSPIYTDVPEEPVEQAYTTYTIVSGDSLWTIANRNNTTVHAIQEANNLTTDMIYVGQMLEIPKTMEPTQTVQTMTKH